MGQLFQYMHKYVHTMPRAQNMTAKGSILKEEEIHCRSRYNLCIYGIIQRGGLFPLEMRQMEGSDWSAGGVFGKIFPNAALVLETKCVFLFCAPG